MQYPHQGSTTTLGEVEISPRKQHLFAVMPAPFQAKISEAQSLDVQTPALYSAQNSSPPHLDSHRDSKDQATHRDSKDPAIEQLKNSKPGHGSSNSLIIRDNPYEQPDKGAHLQTERNNQSQATFAYANALM